MVNSMQSPQEEGRAGWGKRMDTSVMGTGFEGVVIYLRWTAKRIGATEVNSHA
jgi:hypothetical protein